MREAEDIALGMAETLADSDSLRESIVGAGLLLGMLVLEAPPGDRAELLDAVRLALNRSSALDLN